MFKVNTNDTRTTPLVPSGVFIVNFEHVIAGWDFYKDLRDRLLISLLILKDFKRINFYPPWNHKKTISFLIISGEIEIN